MSSRTTQPLRILLAEDDPAERLRLAESLKGAGFEPVEVEDRGAALRALHHGRLDVLVLAFGRPGLIGTDVFAEARTRASEVPMILLTQPKDIQLAEKAMQQGANMCLTKPVWDDELISSIHKVLHTPPPPLGDLSPGEREARLRQSQRMEVLGRLASGVAHDLNNLVTVMVGYSEIVLHHLEPTHPMRADLEEIQKAGDRAVTLTRQLLSFSRKQEFAPTLLDLNALIANMDQMLRRLIREDIEQVMLLRPGLGRVKADAGQLEQVLMNLVINARDAMPHGGRLTLETASVHLDELELQGHPHARPGPYVMLAVKDTGCGMDGDTQARIFEPFFTTKEPDRGTGLGLSIVWDIVRRSGGIIDFTSKLNQGTTFRIYLPVVAESAAALVPLSSNASTLPGGKETVLVVEDNDNIRALVREILRRTGYTVLEARHGNEAFALCERYQGRIHLLVTDVVMPQMGARELAVRLACLCPNLKVLFMSGYASRELAEYDLVNPELPLIEKPFTPEAFARMVRAVLDG